MPKHLDPGELKRGIKVASLSQDVMQDELGLPRRVEYAIRGGKLRADGLLALQIHKLVQPVERRQRGGGGENASMWCAGRCAACDSPSAVGPSEVDELTEALAGWFDGQSAVNWVEQSWQVRRGLDDSIVRTSGVRQWLEHARGTVPVEAARPALASLANLLVGLPARRYQLVCFELPAECELRQEISLPDGWHGGGLPRSLLAALYPFAPAWEYAHYPGFNPYEARALWWAWRAEAGMPPYLPDLLELAGDTSGFWQITVAEQLITLLHAVGHPGRVIPLARFVAYEGHGIQALDGMMNPAPEPWDLDEAIDPLEVDDETFEAHYLDAYDVDSVLYTGLLDYRRRPDLHAQALHGLASNLAGLDVTSTAATRAARAASHVGRDLGEEARNPVAAALDYSIALELLLSEGQRRGEITQGLAQSAAHIAGTDDDDRTEIARVVRDLYGASSDYRHGSEPPLTSDGSQLFKGSKLAVDLDLARGVVRGVAAGVLYLLGENRVEPAEFAGRAAIDSRVSAMLEAAVHRMHAAIGLSLTELDASFSFRGDGTMMLPIRESLPEDGQVEETTVTYLPNSASPEQDESS